MRTLTNFSVLMGILLLIGCTSTGNLGVVTRSSADPGELLKSAQGYQAIGPTDGKACRYFLLAVVPWGKSDMAEAIDEALAKSGGDALLNVSVSSSLYGFIPIYNVFSYTCTTVRGIAIKFS